LVLMILVGMLSDNIYTRERDFKIEIKESGYKFIWDNQTRSN
jgi:hypothetical protein